MSRKRAQRQREHALQPELLFEEVPKSEEKRSGVESEQAAQEVSKHSDRPATWTRYGNQDPENHDAKRRAWLREWAQHRKYARSWFTIWSKYSGYYQASIPTGAESWARFLDDGTYYDVYCLFVNALTPSIPLSHYLEDASKRGEIKGLVIPQHLKH